MIRKILISISYVVATIFVIGGSIVLVAYSQGYNYDFAHYKFIRRGLVLINTNPSGAYITINGKFDNKRTYYHDNLTPGIYHFKLDLPGYVAWTKDLSIIAGQVTDARYIILVPNKPIKTTFNKINNAYQALAIASDHKIMAYSSSPTPTEGSSVWTQNINNNNPVKVMSLSPASDTSPAETIQSVQISNDDSHLLVVSSNGTTLNYRLMNVDGSNQINLTTTYKTDFGGTVGLKFSKNDWQELFWIDSSSNLRRLEIGTGTVSNTIAKGVSQLNFANNNVIFVESTQLGQSVERVDIHNISNPSRLIQALPVSSSYDINYANYGGVDELVVIPQSTHEAILYSGVYGSSPVSTVIAKNVNSSIFSPNYRFIALYSDSQLITYDSYLSTPTSIINYKYTISPPGLQSISWFDNFHLLLGIRNTTVFSDFDGTNQVVIDKNSIPNLSFPSNDQHSINTIEPTKNGQTLVNFKIL
jgi:PEGA domain